MSEMMLQDAVAQGAGDVHHLAHRRVGSPVMGEGAYAA
jgi:hypothetical protein